LILTSYYTQDQSYDDQYHIIWWTIWCRSSLIITQLLRIYVICILIAYTILAHVSTACIFILIRNNYYTFVYFLKRQQYRSYHKTMQILTNK